MIDKLPGKILIELDGLSEDVKILEDKFNINIYNSMLLEDIFNNLRNENNAINTINNIKNYQNFLSDIDKPSEEYLNMINVIKNLSMLIFDILKIHKLYVNNELAYNLLGIKNKDLYLKRSDLNLDDEIVKMRTNELYKYMVDDKFNIGLYRFLSEYANR